MSVLKSISDGVQSYFDKRNEDREVMDNLRHEAEAQKRLIFEEEFKKNALEVAKAEAKKEAAEKSGLQKLRAMNRTRRLNEIKDPSNSIFGKLGEYTQKNLARREENLKRTHELREAAKKMREEKLREQQQQRQERIAGSSIKKPFQK